jgi:hypothetical protein
MQRMAAIRNREGNMIMTGHRSTPTPLTPPGRFERHGSRVFDDQRHDPYQPAGKLPEPTQCLQCGAVYHKGRWQWGGAPETARSDTCPACRRTHDQLPAGWLTLDGPFIVAHEDELIALVHHEAAHERREHPQNRIMQIEMHDGQIEISTTDIHLPQRIGEKLKNAYHGKLTINYAEDEYSVRLHWHR